MNRTPINLKITQCSKNQQMIIDRQTHRVVTIIAACHCRTVHIWAIVPAYRCAAKHSTSEPLCQPIAAPQNQAPHQGAKVLDLVLILTPVVHPISHGPKITTPSWGGAPLRERQGNKKIVLCEPLKLDMCVKLWKLKIKQHYIEITKILSSSFTGQWKDYISIIFWADK